MLTDIPNRRTPNETPMPAMEGADEAVEMVQFYVDDVSVR